MSYTSLFQILHGPAPQICDKNSCHAALRIFLQKKIEFQKFPADHLEIMNGPAGDILDKN